MVATSDVPMVFSSCFLRCHGLSKWKRNFVGTPHPFCWLLARVAPIQYGRNAMYHPHPLVRVLPLAQRYAFWRVAPSGAPRPSLVKVGNRMLQAFPAEAWSTRAAVNRSFSEALRGDERKSSAAASSSPHLLPALAAVSRSILANLARAVLVRARGAKRVSR